MRLTLRQLIVAVGCRLATSNRTAQADRV